MRTMLFACGLALALPSSLLSDAALTLRVSPQAMLAPGFVTVRATIAANADNRAMDVVAESPNFFRSSRLSLDGERAPRVNEVVFRSLPAGRYEVSVTLLGTTGRRATASRWLQIVDTGGH